MKTNVITKSKNQFVIDDYVTTYNKFTRNSVTNTIETAKIVSEIWSKVNSEELDVSDLKYFCNEVNLNPATSQFRKFLCIADHADRIENYIDQFPSAVSVIYQITTLDADNFEELVNTNQLNPKLTLSRLNKLFPPSRNSKSIISSISNDLDVNIKISASITDDSKNRFVSSISESIDKFLEKNTNVDKAFLLFNDLLIKEVKKSELTEIQL